jgi:hypothetical protein
MILDNGCQVSHLHFDELVSVSLVDTLELLQVAFPGLQLGPV